MIWKASSYWVVLFQWICIIVGTDVVAVLGDEKEEFDSSSPSLQDVLAWIREKRGAMINTKIDVESSGLDNGRDYLVAIEDIEPEETLLTIPGSAAITADLDSQSEGDYCETVLLLENEYKEGEESDFFPYTSFLMDNVARHLGQGGDVPDSSMALSPRHWSPRGKEWIQKLVGRELVPQNFGLDGTFMDECVLDDEQKEYYEGLTEREREEVQAALTMVYTRSWSGTLVPLIDSIPFNRTLANVKRSASSKNPLSKRRSGAKPLVDFKVEATRAIRRGERLYLAARTTSDTFKLHGWVEPYPQRWAFDTGYRAREPPTLTMDSDMNEAVFDDDSTLLSFDLLQEGDGRFGVDWRSGDLKQPSFRHVSWLISHRKRLHKINVTEETAALGDDPKEQQLAARYYNALRTALDQAVIAAHAGYTGTKLEDETCEASSSSIDNQECDNLSQRYDTLEYRVERLDYNRVWISDVCGVESFDTPNKESVNTVYQRMQWSHFDSHFREDSRETCLHLDNTLHSCSAFRPHVHETIIHYPAGYLAEVKRVLYVGGGDLIILHEILKYPSLEMVIGKFLLLFVIMTIHCVLLLLFADVTSRSITGLELDQAVVRSSYRHYGVQPHFDNEKVHWWFGDASKSLAMLPPEEYHGTFDLVVIDLLAYIFDALQVGDESLVDYMMRFVKPDGILVRQEDFLERHVVDFARHVVEFEVHDMPYSCVQSFTMGSNGIDFSKKVPIDHEIETIYYGPMLKNNTSIWSHIHSNPPATVSTCKRSAISNVSAGSQEQSASSPRYGVLVVIEAEDVSISLEDQNVLVTKIKNSLEQIGFRIIHVIQHLSSWSSVVIFMEEGYVVARCWPEDEYCAFDLQLWNSIDKKEKSISALVSAVGGDLTKSTSSFLVLTGGMYGIDMESVNEMVSGPLDVCKDETTSVQTPNLGDPEYAIVLSEMMTLQRKLDPTYIVVCGDQTKECTSLDIVKKNSDSYGVVPLWTCPSVESDMIGCELSTRDTLQNKISDKKVNGVILDPSAPREMGQILLHIVNNTRIRYNLLDEEFIVLVPTIEETGKAWREALLERFREDTVIFNPVFHSNIFFFNETRQLEYRVLSVGDTDFYQHLMDAWTKVKERTLLSHDMRNTRVGMVGHVPDFSPGIVATDEDYDLTDAFEQWQSQHPMGHQTIFQYELQRPATSIPIGASVLINDHIHPWDGTWLTGKVLDVEDNGDYRVLFNVSGVEQDVSRHLLLEISDHSREFPLKFADLVLYRWIDYGPKETWYQGSIVKVNPDGSYKLQAFDGYGELVIMERGDIILRSEKPQKPTDLPLFSGANFSQLMDDVFEHLDSEDPEETAVTRISVGDGSVIASPFAGGYLVASWDGSAHIDVNIFVENGKTNPGRNKAVDTFVEKTVKSVFAEEVPALVKVQSDTHPRGYGRVVNSRQDLESMWFGDYV